MRLIYLSLCLLIFLSATAIAAPTVSVAPHKALYKMTIGKMKKGSSLQDVSGSMLFDWSDTCDGWAQQQYIRFRFSFSDGARSDINSTMMTWEAKDGSDFTFYVKRKTDGIEDESYKGRAQITEKGSVVKFTVPKEAKDLVMPDGTIFPTAHTIQIISNALSGQKLFSRKVFDGAQKDGVGDISAFIGAQKGKATIGEVAKKLIGHPLLDVPAWPVRMAFYEAGKQTSKPEYEMEMLLQSNGIARTIEIDYGEFTILGTLAKLEKSTALACPDTSIKTK